MNNFSVRSLIIGNSGTYRPLNVRGYESGSDLNMMTDMIARGTMDGSAVSKIGDLVLGENSLLNTSHVAGAEAAIEGSLSERRNIFHMVIDEHGFGDGVVSRYLVTGYVAPGGVVDGVVLPNAPFYINNVMRLHQGMNGWVIRSNILTNTIKTEGMSAGNPLEEVSRHRVRLYDSTKAASQHVKHGQVRNIPHLAMGLAHTTEFINQRENQAGNYLSTLGTTYANQAQSFSENQSTSEMLDESANKLLVGDGEVIINFMMDMAHMANGIIYFNNMEHAFNLGSHNMKIVDDGSMANINNYSDPNSSTSEGQVAYTVANNFGDCALGAGIIACVLTFTNNAQFDPKFNAAFAYYNEENHTVFATDGMDQIAAIDGLMRSIAERVLPHISHGNMTKTTVKVQFGAYKDIIIDVDCGNGVEQFIYPAFSSSSYTLTIAGRQHASCTMGYLALATNQVVGTRNNFDNAPIGMSDVNNFHQSPVLGDNTGNVSMSQQNLIYQTDNGAPKLL